MTIETFNPIEEIEKTMPLYPHSISLFLFDNITAHQTEYTHILFKEGSPHYGLSFQDHVKTHRPIILNGWYWVVCADSRRGGCAENAYSFHPFGLSLYETLEVKYFKEIDKKVVFRKLRDNAVLTDNHSYSMDATEKVYPKKY